MGFDLGWFLMGFGLEFGMGFDLGMDLGMGFPFGFRFCGFCVDFALIFLWVSCMVVVVMNPLNPHFLRLPESPPSRTPKTQCTNPSLPPPPSPAPSTYSSPMPSKPHSSPSARSQQRSCTLGLCLVSM